MASTPPFTRIGLGCARVGSLTNPSSPAESRRLIELAFSLGVRLFDTANIYGQGDSERILGRALAGKRDQAFIVTKIGKRFSAKMRLIRPFKPIVKRLRRPSPAGDAFVASQRAANVGFDLDHRTMERDVAAALKRLRIDHIDMLLLHSPSAATVADPAVVDTLSAIRDKGMIAGYGVSADSADVVAAALAMPGIVGSVHLPEKNFAAIVGERKDQVEAAIKVVKAEWQELVSDTTSENIHDRLKETADAGTSLDAEGHTADPKAALDAVGGGQTWTYKLPYLTHSPIEPKSALVNVTPEQVEVWVSTQSPFDVRTGVARTLGRDESEVVVHGMHPGGAFGSKIVPQAELEAAWMSNAVGKPVKLIWDRIEEMMFGQFRPAMRIEITAGLDTAGKIAGWNYDAYTADYYPELAEAPTASASDWSANILELYAVETSKTTLFNGISPLPPFFWRVNGATSNTYARESTIDILAEQAGVDPITFRDGMLAEKPRLAAVMHAAVDSSGWTPGVGPTGQGFGIALGFDAETPIAEVAQVEVNTETGELKILRMDIAVDPGLAVNPEAIKHQIGGGAMMSLSGALREELTFANGKLTNGTFAQYAPIVMRDSPPTINVTVISDPTLPMSGIGEPGVAPALGAVANAIYDACGARLFQAPFTPERILAALAESSASPVASPAASPAS